MTTQKTAAPARVVRFGPGAGSPADLATAFNQNNAVLVYTAAVESTALPRLPNSEEWWDRFTEYWPTVVGHVRTWDEVAGLLRSVPESIVSYQDAWSAGYANARVLLDDLRAGPADRHKRAELAAVLLGLADGADARLAGATTLLGKMSTYAAHLTVDIGMLMSAITAAAASTRHEADLIKELDETREQLRRDVDRYSTWITAGAITTGVSIWLAPVGVVVAFAFPVGLGIIALGVAGTATGIGLAIARDSKIKEAQRKITEITGKLDEAGVQLAALEAVQSMVADLKNKVELAAGSVAGLRSVWATVKSELLTAVGMLRRAGADLGEDEFTRMGAELTLADDEWTVAEKTARQMLAVTYHAPDPLVPLAGNAG